MRVIKSKSVFFVAFNELIPISTKLKSESRLSNNYVKGGFDEDVKHNLNMQIIIIGCDHP
ncbi:hypothetical protein RP20_CCG001596 [Aedes albopictus]|nr:hypothetical protein RP20_CCG001596 [Aedes albopictus]